ncbi:hypothetical protein PV08_04357 [Exophiala spinifera]|uniref:F-box domain-containing protein n=1 Tax=Exophiala spinifera TaxID=91928 RepID=A0A0D1YPN1_9EURO|nr:uncharacterized protein PV08_04357 [Exophiala spinifera]KIW17166.1 hypothetical protein PV08_04357 [Exophiala spinifera]
MAISAAMPPGQHPYLVEINRVTSALSELSGITRLALLGPRDASKNTPATVVSTSVLEWVVDHYHHLRDLRLEIESCRLDSLRSLTALRALRLSGYSETSPLKTADVLSRLGSLEDLYISGPSREVQIQQKHGTPSRIVQSVSNSTFEQVKPLKRLSIKEVVNPRGEGSGLLTFKTVKALYEIHRDSLQVLHISASETPSGSFVAYLSAFLIAASELHELYLTWPGMDDDFVDNFPNPVRRLKLAVSSPAQAQAIVYRLAAVRYRLRFLQQIRFSVINAPTTVMELDHKQQCSSFGLPIPHLAVHINSPWPTSWEIWQPLPQD